MIPVLATAIEAAPFTIGDVPPAPAVVAALPHWLQIAVYVLGMVVPLASLLVGFLNQYIRTAKARGERVPTWMLAAGAALNVAALNGDKAVEQAKAAKGGES